jgi:hypothetical protein
VQGSPQLVRTTLDSLIRERIVARAVRAAGASVTPADVEKARADLRKQAGGERKLRAALLTQQDIAPADIDPRLRQELGVAKVAKAAGLDLHTPQGNARLNAKLAKVSRSLHVTVNPRYGAWNDTRSGLGNPATPWLRDTSHA